MTRFAWGAASDTGRVRQANEDSYLVVDGLFAVADGMGGHQAGEVASHLALETLQTEFTAAGTDVLVRAVENANHALVSRSTADPELAGMGTTLVAMALVDWSSPRFQSQPLAGSKPTRKPARPRELIVQFCLPEMFS